MNEEDARVVLLARAIELYDPQRAILGGTQARSAAAPAATAASPGAVAPIAHARAVVEQAGARAPAVRQALAATRWPVWLAPVAAIAALLAGLALNELGGGGSRVNILSIPLTGMLVWNLLMYLLLAVGALLALARPGRPGTPDLHGATSFLAHAVFARRVPRRARATATLADALAGFSRDWLGLGAPLHAARIRTLLHLSAALLALGAVAGMYLRGLGFEFLAGWESTFLDEHAVHRWLTIVLGPAAALTGTELPSADRIAALRWSPVQPGENAARWIHLYAVSAALVIVLPRLALAAWSAASARRLARDFPFDAARDPWWRRLARPPGGPARVVQVLPYSHLPSAEAVEGLVRALGSATGDELRSALDEPVPYGADDAMLERAVGAARGDWLVLLFSAAATPEHEIHAAAADRIARALARHPDSGSLLVIVDESGYRARLSGQAGAAARLDARRAAWMRVLDAAGVRAAAIDLESSDARLPDAMLARAAAHAPGPSRP